MAVPGDPQRELQFAANNPGPAPSGGGPDATRSPEAKDIKPAPAPWTDEFALQIVKKDFERASAFRTLNHDWRWDENDKILHARMPQRVWEGTLTPRSSLGVRLAWQQERSVRPRIMESIFSSQDGIFFECFPRPGTSLEESRACREHTSAQLEETGFKQVVDQVVHSLDVHGTGIMKIGWLRQERDREIWQDEFVPRVVQAPSGPVALGGTRRFRKKKFKEKINRPFFDYVSLRDFYVDPSHTKPTLDGAGFVIQRAPIGMDQLLVMQENDPSYKLPTKSKMIELIRQRAGVVPRQADAHKMISAIEGGLSQAVPFLGSLDPAKWPFEILEYWTPDRLVTLFNGDTIIRNIPNPYGRIPYRSAVFSDVLDRFYGVGIAEIVDPEQRVQQGILNARLDELSLIIHGQIVYQEGAVIGKHQLRPRPGGAIGVQGDVRQAIQTLQRQPVTGEAFGEIQQSQVRAQATTGITDVVVQGAPQSQSSITRTKFGTATLAQAAFSRIQYIVETVTDQLIVPALRDVHELNKRMLDPQQPIEIIGKLGEAIEIDPMAIMGGRFKFEMRAASRMAAKQAMSQSLPFILQTVLNPALMQLLAQQGTQPNIQAIIRDVMEVTGWRSRDEWFTQLDEQQMQQRQQQEQQGEQLKTERDEARADSRADLLTQQQTGDITKSVLSEALKGTPGAVEALSKALQEIQL